MNDDGGTAAVGDYDSPPLGHWSGRDDVPQAPHPWCPCRPHGDGETDFDSDAHPSLSSAWPVLRSLGEAEGSEEKQETTAERPVEIWEVAYMCVVLLVMFVALLSDRVGADHVMLVALTMCMAAGIVTVEEGLEGFANEGVLTVLALFVVAAGISLTGALDWYMGRLLGRPRNAASAQLRLVIPVAVISAFLNNTPVVAVMIPIVQRWGKNVGVSPQQLLVPLSFASILGGTCTLIGTSTNLVVVGLLNDQYPDSPPIGLFDLGRYGIPVAFAGVAYILVASPFLLPGGRRQSSATGGQGRGGAKGGRDAVELPAMDGSAEEILLGARLTKWSPAAGRSVQRSGLRDTGGIYLVSVHRNTTGNVHRAVGPDFVLNVGDVLYFTGLVETFGDFCEEHGLEVVTNEVENDAGAVPMETIAEEGEEEIGVEEGEGKRGPRGIGRGEEKKEEMAQGDCDGNSEEHAFIQEERKDRAVRFADKARFISAVASSIKSSVSSSFRDDGVGDGGSSSSNGGNGNGGGGGGVGVGVGVRTGGAKKGSCSSSSYCKSGGLAVVVRGDSELASDLKVIAENIAAEHENAAAAARQASPMSPPPPLESIDVGMGPTLEEIGTTKESLVRSDVDDRWRSINRMTDVIRGITPTSDGDSAPVGAGKGWRATPRRMDTPSSMFDASAPAKIVVVTDASQAESHPLVAVAINSPDRPGLLLDISKGLLRLGIQLHHSEASVARGRSLSVWKCEVLDGGVTDVEEIWSVLSALLEADSGVEAVKRRGLRVVRAVVTRGSRLVGLTASEASFRDRYRAAIVAVQRGGGSGSGGTRNAGGASASSLSQVRFGAGDLLVLQANDDSPLLEKPPEDFYLRLAKEESERVGSGGGGKKGTVPSVKSLVSMVSRSFSQSDVRGNVDNGADLMAAGARRKISLCTETKRELSEDHVGEKDGSESGFFIPDDHGSEDEHNAGVSSLASGNSLQLDDEETQNLSEAACMVWKDLQVIFPDEHGEGGSAGDGGPSSREFLAAMQIARNSGLSNKTAEQSGLDKLPGVTLVSIERPEPSSDTAFLRRKRSADGFSQNASVASVEESSLVDGAPLMPIPTDQPLAEGDIIWFAGSAAAVGDLRKIPGLKSYESDEVRKINEKIHDRRLVQAVIARKGPLVGKTVKEVRFRTRYGAAVIAVHREGKRLHEHPGKVKLQAGDVLLLEAGPTFLARNTDNAKSFALLSEVRDSAPPRLRLLIPALLIAVAMLAVFTAGVTSLLVCALVAATLMVLIGILSQQEARDAVNWEIYVTIACAFGIGTALTNSGVAGGVANALVAVGTAVGIGDAGLFGAVYFATFLISNVVTNNAAAALIFPIAMDAAEQFGTDQLLMSYCIMLGASASFMSPFGYTTNLLIYGPGGYKYKDFLAIGTPMQLVLWILSVAVLSQGDAVPWYLSWIITSAVLVFISIVRVCNITVCDLFTARFQCAAGTCKKRPSHICDEGS